MTRRRIAVLGLSAVLLAASAAPAQATLRVTVAVTQTSAGTVPSSLHVEDLNGLDDRVVIEEIDLNGNPAYLISNNNAGDIFAFDIGTGCTERPNSGGRQAICERRVDFFRVDLEAGDDALNAANAPVGSSNLIGGPGNDVITGHAGDDGISGGDGQDSIAGGGDADRISGDAGGDSIAGGAGNDEIRGGTGFDGITGGNGNDEIEGQAGNDSLRGGPGNDLIRGSSGNDTVVGNGGADSLRGNNGNDTITSKEAGTAAEPRAADKVRCGLGDDDVVADLQDQDIDLVPNGTCEEVERSPIGEHPHVRIPASTLDVSPAGLARVRLVCPRATTIGCRGTLSLRLARRGARRPARTAYVIRPGRSARVTVRLTAAETRRLRRGDRGILESVERGRRGPKTTIRTPRLR